jgi:hypothetical protein
MSMIPKYTFGESLKALFGLAMKSHERVAELEARLAKLERLPGEKGEDGAAGLGFDDLTMGYDGQRELTFNFIKGDKTKSFSFELPIPIYIGVYRDTVSYKKGDGVTWAGSYWTAQKDNPDQKPGAEDSGWQLAVKRGRDGKDREVVKSEPSRDSIQLNPKRES